MLKWAMSTFNAFFQFLRPFNTPECLYEVQYNESRQNTNDINRYEHANIPLAYTLYFEVTLNHILSQWAWFSMSTKTFIGSDQNFAHPLLHRGG